MFHLDASSALTSYPEHYVSLSGDNATFYCGTSQAEPMDWKYKHLTSHYYDRIADDGIIVEGLENKYSVVINGKNVLTIYDTSVSDAGTYRCIDVANTGEMATAELIVLGKKAIVLFK